MKTTNIFEKGHNNKGWEKIENWIDDEDICVNDFLALVCAKFSQIPQVKSNEVLSDTTNLIIVGDVYEITIRKVNNAR